MKKYFLFLFFLLQVYVCFSQVNIKKTATAFAFSFVSGAAHGTRETLKNHWGYVADKYPDLNPDVWNPDKSWLLKYNDRDYSKGRNNTPIWFTDPYHALASINQASAFCAGFTIAIGKKRKVKYYLLDAAASFAGYTLGNFVTYKRNIFIFK